MVSLIVGIKMGTAKLHSKQVLLIRTPYDVEILQFITDEAKKNGIAAATFTAIGALKSARLGFYDQQKHKYIEDAISVPVEIASCIGNISLKNGKPYVHAHAVLANADGVIKAGHLLEGRVFAAEIHLVDLVGEKIERKHDTVTGLHLWDL